MLLYEIRHTIGIAQHQFVKTIIVVRLWTGRGDVLVSLIELHLCPAIRTGSGS
jgi:hypothetical protein